MQSAPIQGDALDLGHFLIRQVVIYSPREFDRILYFDLKPYVPALRQIQRFQGPECAFFVDCLDCAYHRVLLMMNEETLSSF